MVPVMKNKKPKDAIESDATYHKKRTKARRALNF